MSEKIVFFIVILLSFLFIGYSAFTSIHKTITNANNNMKKIEIMLMKD